MQYIFAKCILSMQRHKLRRTSDKPPVREDNRE